ncbi:MAG TPA: TetR/AcrR family transcriptional regulator [Polyangiaceae bacterium]|nr:TetR/AcrR family transcriptional regulator [Polyangiaceae bacterium]
MKKKKVVVWEREEPSRQPALAALSRKRIVRAALELADTDGLDAVSLRNVASALGAGPMRLYGYVDSKEELLDLLVDEVYGRIVAKGPIRGDLRNALHVIARRTREISRAHPWFAALLSGRVHLGPNALAHLEASLAAIAPHFRSIDDALAALHATNAYTIGAIQLEASELRAERASGMKEKEWQDASWPWIERMIETGRFPTLAVVVRDAKHPPRDVEFERGLACVLDGISARTKSPKSPRRSRRRGS